MTGGGGVMRFLAEVVGSLKEGVMTSLKARLCLLGGVMMWNFQLGKVVRKKRPLNS